MEHVVFHPGADGSPAFARFAAVEEAVAFVERLRNDGVVEASLFGLTPVPLVVRTYFRVEVPGGEAPAESSVPEAPAAEAFTAPPAPVAFDEPAAAAFAPEPVAFVPDQAAGLPEPAAEDFEPVGADAPEPAVTAVAPAAEPVAGNGRRSLGFFTH